MNRAICRIRAEPHYRADAFQAGLKAAGFKIVPNIPDPRPLDVLVIWNRYGQGDQEASRFERAGAAVLVAENGYIGHHENEYAKQYAADGQQLYALALSQHNGAGQWWIGAPYRWREHGIQIKPWRKDGEHVLVLPQRGIGPSGVAMPRDWPQSAARRIQAMTSRPVRLRAHPGNEPAQKPLEADLAGAWCAVTWGSGAALKAICAGVPVFHEFKNWIGKRGALPLAEADLENDYSWARTGFMSELYDEARQGMLDRVSWAQWTVAELATGEPIRRLLNLHRHRLEAA